MEKSFILFLGQHMPAFIVAADPLMRVSQRVVFRKAFPLHMAIFDEQLFVLETDVLVHFDHFIHPLVGLFGLKAQSPADPQSTDQLGQ